MYFTALDFESENVLTNFFSAGNNGKVVENMASLKGTLHLSLNF